MLLLWLGRQEVKISSDNDRPSLGKCGVVFFGRDMEGGAGVKSLF